MPRENDEVCSDRSPHEAKRNAGVSGKVRPGFRRAPSGLQVMPRENEDACAIHSAVIPGPAAEWLKGDASRPSQDGASGTILVRRIPATRCPP